SCVRFDPNVCIGQKKGRLAAAEWVGEIGLLKTKIKMPTNGLVGRRRTAAVKVSMGASLPQLDYRKQYSKYGSYIQLTRLTVAHHPHIVPAKLGTWRSREWTMSASSSTTSEPPLPSSPPSAWRLKARCRSKAPGWTASAGSKASGSTSL